MEEAEAGGSQCILKDVFDVSDNLGKDGWENSSIRLLQYLRRKQIDGDLEDGGNICKEK